MLDDDQIIRLGGTQKDINEIACHNGADLTEEDVYYETIIRAKDVEIATLKSVINADDMLLFHLTQKHENERLVRANAELKAKLELAEKALSIMDETKVCIENWSDNRCNLFDSYKPCKGREDCLDACRLKAAQQLAEANNG